MHRRAFLTGITGTVIFLAGCNQLGGSNDKTTESSTDTPSSTETATSTSSPEQTTTGTSTEAVGSTSLPALVSTPDAVRTCESSVASPNPPDWHDIPVVAGPIGFAPPMGDTEGLARPFKVLIYVKPNTTVTVLVPESERERVALSYDPNSDPDKLENGQRSVRFESCDRLTEFPGRIFTEIDCVTLQVWVKAENHPRKVTLPIGVESCN